MFIPILTTVGLAAAVIWLSFAAVKYLFPRLSEARQASMARIARDPGDYVRAWVARIAPSRLRVQQEIATAQRAVKLAEERETHVRSAFKDGKAPTLPFKITVLTMLVLWFIVLIAAFFLDLPIINSVSGGNVFYGFLGVLLILGVPIIGSVLLGHFFLQWRRGDLSQLLFSVAGTIILAALVIEVAFLTTLAPIRAEVEYAEKLRTAELQKLKYQEAGDQNAVRFADQNIADLQSQEQRSAEWNSVLVPTAAVAEFATGFFVPLAIPVLMLGETRASRRKAQRVLDTAQDRVDNQRARQYRRLSRTFQRVGLTQADLQRHFAAVAAENQTGPATAATLQGARTVVAEELQAQAPRVPEPTTDPPDTTGRPIAAVGDVPAAAPQATRTAPRDNDGAVTTARRTPAQDPTQENDVHAPDESFDLS